MLNILKNDVVSLLDTALLYLNKYRTELDNSHNKELKDTTVEYHIFSCAILDILERSDTVTAKISELIRTYDAENKFSDRDATNSLADACISFRKSVETYIKDCEAALKNQNLMAVRALTNNTDMLTRKILFLKSNL